jgi:hypothetical protein
MHSLFVMRAPTRALCVVLLSSLAFACGGTDAGNGDDGPGNGGPGNGSPDSGAGTHPSGNDGGALGATDSGTPTHPTDSGSPQGQDSGQGDDGTDSGGGDDSGSTTGQDSGPSNPDGGPFVPADHPTFPIMSTSGSGLIKSPQVQAVFFKDYDQIAEVTKMLNGLPTAQLATGASFWTGSVGEYGIGPLTVLPPITVTDNAPTADTDPAGYLEGKLSDPAFKNVTQDTILAIFYPAKTPLGGSCAAQTPGYGGYHDRLSNGTPYAVMSECAKFGPITSALDMVTVAVSHEIIEAVTDVDGSGFVGLDDTEFGLSMGQFLGGNAENGDLCTINTGFGRGTSSYPYLLQRGWSNKAAKAGTDPCAPDLRPSQPYVGAYPVMPDAISSLGANGKGVVIPVQSSKTIDVKLFSLEPTADFTVAARQSSQVIPPTLQFTWDKTTGHNGDTLHLTIKAVGNGGTYESFIVTAALPGFPAADTQKAAWAGVVTHK